MDENTDREKTIYRITWFVLILLTALMSGAAVGFVISLLINAG